MSTTRRVTKRSKLFWTAFWQGMAASVIFTTPCTARAQRAGSDVDALRGDWQKIGNDFHGATKKINHSGR